MKYKVLRQKSGFKEFIWFDELNNRYTCEIPQLLNKETTLENFIEYQKSIGYSDIDLSDCELIDYVLIEKKEMYVKLLWLLKPLLNLMSLIKINNKNNNDDNVDINKDDINIYNTIIDTEIENCELIFPRLKNIFDE